MKPSSKLSRLSLIVLCLLMLFGCSKTNVMECPLPPPELVSPPPIPNDIRRYKTAEGELRMSGLLHAYLDLYDDQDMCRAQIIRLRGYYGLE